MAALAVFWPVFRREKKAIVEENWQELCVKAAWSSI
jgi:hypothetical protein